MKCLVFNIIIVFVIINGAKARLSLNPEDLRQPFDQDLYRNVLDSELCRVQARNISRENFALFFRFQDAGIRTPRGLLGGNLVDLGNYFQCLAINEPLGDTRVEGKYCAIRVPANQSFHWPGFPRPRWFDPNDFALDDETLRNIQQANAVVSSVRAAAGFEDLSSSIGFPPETAFQLSVCIPKPCTAQEALSSFFFNLSAVGFRFEEEFCRLPNDKPWMPVDTVAVVLFSLIGLLTLACTCYELNHTFILKRDPKTAGDLYTSFSLYKNTIRLFTFRPVKGALECLDGIRVISLMWIIVGHTFAMYPFNNNAWDIFSWLVNPEALWLSTAPMAVDTFFGIAGVLLVYTTAGKMNGWQLLRQLHLFYLHRLLRLLPALATMILLEASVFHRIADGPYWSLVARNAQRCRTFWWTTLLHVQNWVNPMDMCIAHSWYIAIDVQLYFVSPLVLFWVFSGNKKVAWSALIISLLAVISASSVFSFIMELPAGSVALSRLSEFNDYMKHFYFNTLTRGSPFFVGMVFGYILHLYRGKKVRIHYAWVTLAWINATLCFALAFYTTNLIVQWDWDNQIVDSLINSFQKPIWALGLGWVIFACVHGYGGPVNWLLSLPIWKLPSRVSYTMYLYHYSQLFIAGDMQLSTVYWTVPRMFFTSIGHMTLTLVVSIIVGIVIELPFGILFKKLIDLVSKKPAKTATESGVAKKN